ncbi:unnamed protein product [Prunus armeniaca]
MAVVMLVNYHKPLAITVQSQSQNPSFNSRRINPNQFHAWRARRRPIINGLNGDTESDPDNPQDKEVDNLGVKAALCVLKFYKSKHLFFFFFLWEWLLIITYRQFKRD